MPKTLIAFAVVLPFLAVARADELRLAAPRADAARAREVTEYIQQKFYDAKSGVYLKSMSLRRPDYVWLQGVMFSNLTAAARIEPEPYAPRLNAYFRALDAYWDAKVKIPGYEAAPTRGNGNDKYYDDNAWLVITFLEAYESNHDPRFLARAEETLKFVLSGWDDELGGGIWWHQLHKDGTKNVCANGPAAVGCLRLAKFREGKEAAALVEQARRIVKWTVAALQDKDGLFDDRKVVATGEVKRGKLTYNTALMLRALLGLYRATGNRDDLAEAQRIAKAAEWFSDRRSGVYRDPVRYAHFMVEADLELYRTTEEEYLLQRARRNVDALYDKWKANPPEDMISNAAIARVLWLTAETETDAGRAFWQASDKVSPVTEVAVDVKPESAGDAQVRKLVENYFNDEFAANPLNAVALGKHEYDGKLAVPDRAMLAATVARLKQLDDELAKLPVEGVSPAAAGDLRLLRYNVATRRWEMESQRDPWRNPMYYAKALDVSVYLKRDFKPLAERLSDVTAILQKSPAVFAAARENLDPVLPKVFIETAIEVAEGSAAFLKNDVAKEATKVTDKKVRDEFLRSSQLAQQEIASYAAWLKSEKLPKANDAFALGRDGYVRMLRAEMVDLPPDQLLAFGMEQLRKEQARFAQAAAEVDPNAKPVDVYKAIQREHPTAENLIPDARKHLEMIRQFVIDRKIATMPSEVRAKVAETLPPFRATSFASMDTPGPFEKRATEAYYYITPVEPDWTAQQAEEWLGAFNYYTTDVVSIHEAYPGHYLQFLALNASSASDAAKVINSYAFVEGWAHYSEQMLIDEGFAQPGKDATPEERIRGAKYRVAQSGEALLRLCRLCCSIKLHTEGMTIDQATAFFKDNCYYDEKPSRQEAIRGTFDPGYLYYTLGKLMIYKLRSDWQKQQGTEYSLQKFHDELLRHGAPPIRILREMMLQDKTQWPASLPVVPARK